MLMLATVPVEKHGDGRYGAHVAPIRTEHALHVQLDDSFARTLPELCQPWQAAPHEHTELLALNDELARSLGLDPEVARSPEGLAELFGQSPLSGSTPVAQVYAGHQFGNYSPRLGDGRALLLGEFVLDDGSRRDLHLKGSGRTPFARGGDGNAAVGPMLREYVVGEAMHALGIPTTRALAVVATGQHVAREVALPGAVLARVAASHLRVGTFQYAAATGDTELLARVASYAIDRHHPHAAEAAHPYLALYSAVVEAQASLIARWMTVGFVHGVMNTDNMTISGETIDYGPCAFMDRVHPRTVFSSIDHGGRYAYGNQPAIAQWNLARLAEAMLPLFADTPDDAVALATEVLQSFTERYDRHWLATMHAKLGLAQPVDRALFDDLLAIMAAQEVDHTSLFRSLSDMVRGHTARARAVFAEPESFDAWAARWTAARSDDQRPDGDVADTMDRVNPLYIPRNHQVEAALAAATDGDLAPLERLVDVVTHPFVERPGFGEYVGPAPVDELPYRTFCGT
jgi:uncharacterized protein YdiU (UPF0061 family)